MLELENRAVQRGIYINSDFLTLAEQTELHNMKLMPPPTLFGGFENAERKVALFGDEGEMCYPPQFPVTTIKISPLNQKFADELSHRDFLGALMNLGIKREVLGDILVIDNIAYLFCLDNIASYIVEQLKRVKHTSVLAEVCKVLPEAALPQPIEMNFTAASERLDLIISEVFNLSRSDSKEMVTSELVAINSIITTNPSHQLPPDSVVSVRGKGRFIYYGSNGMSKKGKFKISVGIYK